MFMTKMETSLRKEGDITMLGLDFMFVDTIEQAKQLVSSIRKKQNTYRNKYYPPHFTPWESQDGKEHKFVVWFAR